MTHIHVDTTLYHLSASNTPLATLYPPLLTSNTPHHITLALDLLLFTFHFQPLLLTITFQLPTCHPAFHPSPLSIHIPPITSHLTSLHFSLYNPWSHTLNPSSFTLHLSPLCAHCLLLSPSNSWSAHPTHSLHTLIPHPLTPPHTNLD